jgi:hypothetical protein
MYVCSKKLYFFFLNNKVHLIKKLYESLTRFIIKVRSPWASSSGVGGNGRFGGPLLWFVEAVAVLSPDINPGLYENSGLMKS